MSTTGKTARLFVRPLRKSDIKAVQELQRRCFPGIEPWTREQMESQLATFPEGQLAIESTVRWLPRRALWSSESTTSMRRTR